MGKMKEVFTQQMEDEMIGMPEVMKKTLFIILFLMVITLIMLMNI